MRNWNDIIGCLFFIVIGAGVMARAVYLGLGSATEPQAGFFPFLGGIALVILSCALLLDSLKKKDRALQSFGNIGPPLFLMLGLTVYVLILPSLGYILSTTLLSGITLRVLKIRKWWGVAIVSPLLAAGSYLLFSQLLDIPLPKGVMAGLL